MKLNSLVGGLLFMALSACSMPAITAGSNTANSVNSSDLMVLDHHVIPSDAEVNGLKITELSGLAWDEDEQLLYAISDKGRVYHFRLTIKDDLIESVTPVFGAKLRDAKGKKLRFLGPITPLGGLLLIMGWLLLLSNTL